MQTDVPEIIVQWAKRGPGEKLLRDYTYTVRELVPSANIDLLTFSAGGDAGAALIALQQSHYVRSAQLNRAIEFRTAPNDPLYTSSEENFARSGFETAWELTSGGETAGGREIVIAILDAGFDPEHEDLVNNVWQNPAEIPGDGLDNDNNGYVDDTDGWNFTDNRPRHPRNSHGTRVLGLLGAEGDNGLGVSGANWNVKAMLFTINTVADIIAAYAYIIDQRKLYNETDGREGAFVVATNASFGLEGETCKNHSAWGNMYDLLGAVGILTAASTSNRPWDVDEFGDMPTDCTTDFLLGVANLGTNDLLYRSSAYGAESIDLAAPGEGSYTTVPNDRYGNFSSTSAAAPYVSGAMALLYATPCPLLDALVISDPPAAALLVRRALLEAVSPNRSLEFRSASGGSLNVGAAQEWLLERCAENALEEFSITRMVPNPASATVEIQTSASFIGRGATIVLQDALGRTVSIPNWTASSGNRVNLRINVSNLPPGWYSVLLTDRYRSTRSTLVVCSH